MSTAHIESLVTEETQLIENLLRDAGYSGVQAYRLGPFSVRLRIRDPRFQGLSRVARMKEITPWLRRLPEEIQEDLIFVLPIVPGEESLPQFQRMNVEFENPRVEFSSTI